MNQKLVAVSAAGALTFAVFMVVGGPLGDQTNWLADAGITAPTHVATCTARIDTDCRAKANDAGLDVHAYERLRFGVHVTPMRTPYWADGGRLGLPANVPVGYTSPDGPVTLVDDGRRHVQLPPARPGLRQCVEVLSWDDCSLALASTAPAVAAKWGDPIPFALAPGGRRCVRPNYDAGLLCLRQYSDGGTYSFGDRNVFPKAEAATPATCEAVECTVFAGEDPETEL